MAKKNANNKVKGKEDKQNRNYRKGAESCVNKDNKSATSSVKDNVTKTIDHPNDPSWYIGDPIIKKQVTQGYNFDRSLGGPVDLRNVPRANLYAYPGILRLSYIPTYGFAASREDPMNAVANNLYTYINARNSRNTTYDPNDLMLYFICVDSAFQHLGLMRRIYGTMNYANTYNRYLPKGLVESVGGNFEDLQNHMADLQAYINWFTQQIRACVLPSNMPIFKHHQFLVNNVFSDTTDIKSQLYTFTPEGYYTFSLDEDGAGRAVYNLYYDNADLNLQEKNNYKYTLTYDKLVSIANDIINQIRFLWGQADFNMISADIIKALGMENVYTYDLTPVGYTVIPSDDDWIHQQIQNATLWGVPTTTSLYIEQSGDKGYLVSVPSKGIIGISDNMIEPSLYGAERPLNTYSIDPSEDEILEITRFVSIPEVNTVGNTAVLTFKNHADVITTRACIYYFLSDGANGWNLAITEEINGYAKNVSTFTTDSAATVSNEIKQYVDNLAYTHLIMTMMSSFRYHPYIYYQVSAKAGNLTAGYLSPYAFGDTQNVSKVRPDVLKTMNINILNHMMGLSTWTLKS